MSVVLLLTKMGTCSIVQGTRGSLGNLFCLGPVYVFFYYFWPGIDVYIDL